MKVYVNGFWNGFTNRTDGIHFGFFETLLREVLEEDIELGDLDNSEILLETHFSKSVLEKKSWNLSIFFSGEAAGLSVPFPPNISSYTVYMGGVDSLTPNFVPCMLGMVYEFCTPFSYSTVSLSYPKKDICAIISSPVTEGRFRTKFLDLLEERGIHVDRAGNYKNNTPRVPGAYFEKPILDFQSQYKIVLALENTKADFYVTEKIFNPVRAGTVPVYYGSPYIKEYFNKDRFIELTEDSIETVLKEIQEICTSEEAWRKKINNSFMRGSMTEYINKIVKKIKIIRREASPYEIEIIGDLEREPGRRETLNPILDFYKKEPVAITYGKSAEAHSLWHKFNPTKTVGGRSLACNHVATLEQYENTNRFLVIFESDVIPKENMEYINSEIVDLIEEMKEKSIDFIFLGHGCFRDANEALRGIQRISPTLWLKNSSRCTEAYIVSPAGNKKFLKWFRSRGNHNVIDWAFNEFFQEVEGARGCWRVPELFNQGTCLNLYPTTIV